MSAVAIVVRGEELLLHPDRAVIWPRIGAVIVADTHFGKSSVFNRHGLAVPAGTDEMDQERLTRLLTTSGSRRLIVLGDFLHAPIDATSEDARNLERWSRSLSGVHIQVIAGNHDRGVSRGWRGSIDWIDGAHVEPPFCFVHESEQAVSTGADAFLMSGHVHPVIRIRALRKQSARAAAFWLRREGLVLPSFGLFTGGQLISPGPGEQVFAVSPDAVVPFPVFT
jgi:DNA ligase-associated metallophosphoesterase